MRRLRLVIGLALCVALVVLPTTSSPAVQLPLSQSEETPIAEDDAGDTEEPVEHTGSNTTTLLIGAVLLASGIWAYNNRSKRFPGTRFRDPR